MQRSLFNFDLSHSFFVGRGHDPALRMGVRSMPIDFFLATSSFVVYTIKKKRRNGHGF